MSLDLHTIRHNCEVLVDYSHANISVENNDRLTGFSNLNVLSKASSVIFPADNETKRKTEEVVLKTLQGIIDQLQRTPNNECPVFFCNRMRVNNVHIYHISSMDHKLGLPHCITYEWIAKRLLKGCTFRQCEKVQECARTIEKIGNEHLFGVVKELFPENIADKISPDMLGYLRRNVIATILSDLKRRPKWCFQIEKTEICVTDRTGFLHANWLNLESRMDPPIGRGHELSSSSSSSVSFDYRFLESVKLAVQAVDLYTMRVLIGYEKNGLLSS